MAVGTLTAADGGGHGLIARMRSFIDSSADLVQLALRPILHAGTGVDTGRLRVSDGIAKAEAPRAHRATMAALALSRRKALEILRGRGSTFSTELPWARPVPRGTPPIGSRLGHIRVVAGTVCVANITVSLLPRLRLVKPFLEVGRRVDVALVSFATCHGA